MVVPAAEIKRNAGGARFLSVACFTGDAADITALLYAGRTVCGSEARVRIVD